MPPGNKNQLYFLSFFFPFDFQLSTVDLLLVAIGSQWIQ